MTITTRPAPIRPPCFAKASEGRPTRHLAREGPKAVPALHGLQQFQVPFDAEQRFENFFFLVRHDGVEIILAVRVSGTFPGSPVALDYHFTTESGRISSFSVK